MWTQNNMVCTIHVIGAPQNHYLGLFLATSDHGVRTWTVATRDGANGTPSYQPNEQTIIEVIRG